MQHSKLSDHTFKKGKFITPINSIPSFKELSENESWMYGRLPEYLWIALILKKYGRDEGIKKCFEIINSLHKCAPNLRDIRISSIIKLDDSVQNEFYNQMISIIEKDTLTPLTLVLSSSKAPIFSKTFVNLKYSVESRCNTIIDTMQGIMDHQSNEATDIRYIVLCFMVISGKLHLLEKQFEHLQNYPLLAHSDEMMRMIRPFIRASEQLTLVGEEMNSEYIDEFWRCISEMTDCELLVVEIEKENRDLTEYMNKLKSLYTYFIDLYSTSNLLDEKMKVLLGISVYSYRRLKEIYEHNLFNSISGRSCIRVLIENYIMMKYLLKNEKSHENIWKEYQFYGIGQYKIVLEKYREKTELNESHFAEKYVEILVNEYKGEEFINMDTSYFDKRSIREKAIEVGEKELFDLYYDYDSAFEHGLWGAIRETSLIKCNNPAHKYHCIPDVNNEINLLSVLPDCIMVMNKTALLLDEIYGAPDNLINEVVKFEIKPIAKEDHPNSK